METASSGCLFEDFAVLFAYVAIGAVFHLQRCGGHYLVAAFQQVAPIQTHEEGDSYWVLLVAGSQLPPRKSR